MIALEGLGVSLAQRRVLDGVTLAVERGRWTTLIGPNGAGKTTLLRAVGGLVAHEGRIAVAGREPRAMTARERARTIAVVSQAPLLPVAMTVAEYVYLGRTAHLGMLGRASATDHGAVDEAIARLDLTTRADRRLGELSGGEGQRAVLARALAQAAPILILDEPTTALDVGGQQEVLELVAELQAERGLTVLGAMHDLTLAGQYADVLALLDGGRLIGSGPPAEILSEELIARHYRARVRITTVDGAPVVVPARGATATEAVA